MRYCPALRVLWTGTYGFVLLQHQAFCPAGGNRSLLLLSLTVDLQLSSWCFQVVLTSSADKLVKMWSVSEGTCLRTFEGHTAGALRCMFITAGTQLLSAGADGLLKLWDSRTGVNSNTFEGHEDRLWGLAASDGPTESLIASGGGDARVVIWRDVTAAKAAEAEAQEEGLVLKQQELSNALAVSNGLAVWCGI